MAFSAVAWWIYRRVSQRWSGAVFPCQIWNGRTRLQKDQKDLVWSDCSDASWKKQITFSVSHQTMARQAGTGNSRPLSGARRISNTLFSEQVIILIGWNIRKLVQFLLQGVPVFACAESGGRTPQYPTEFRRKVQGIFIADGYGDILNREIGIFE